MKQFRAVSGKLEQEKFVRIHSISNNF